MQIMKSGSDYERYPFGILQKIYKRNEISQEHLHSGICMNPECTKKVTGLKEYCSARCFDKLKYERSVSGSWT